MMQLRRDWICTFGEQVRLRAASGLMSHIHSHEESLYETRPSRKMEQQQRMFKTGSGGVTVKAGVGCAFWLLLSKRGVDLLLRRKQCCKASGKMGCQ